MVTDLLPSKKLRRRKPGEIAPAEPEVNWEAEYDEFGRGYYRCNEMLDTGSGDINSETKIKSTSKHDANLLGSKLSLNTDDDPFDNGGTFPIKTIEVHFPVIDIDIPCAWVPSTTEGHGHLYINQALDWESYLKLLTTMAEVGLVETGFVEAAKKRGQTYVRPAWVKKDKSPMPTHGYF